MIDQVFEPEILVENWLSKKFISHMNCKCHDQSTKFAGGRTVIVD